MESKLRYCKKTFPILDWDLKFSELLVKVKNTPILPKNMVDFIVGAVGQLMYFMSHFKEITLYMRFLRIPRKFSPCMCNLTTDENLTKFVIGFADAAPSPPMDVFSEKSEKTTSDHFHSLDSQIGFMSGLIYLVHFCGEKGRFSASLLTSYNKISPSLGIMKLEAMALEILTPRIKFFSELFKVSLTESTRIFSDNQGIVHVIRDFDKNFLKAKPFYLRIVRAILRPGIPSKNFYYISTVQNLSDGLSRLKTMHPGNLKDYFGTISEGFYDLDTPCMNLGDPQNYICVEEEDKNLDKFIPGIYDEVFSHKPGSLKSLKLLSLEAKNQSVTQNIMKSLVSCNKQKSTFTKEPCCMAIIHNKKGNIIKSICNKDFWSAYEIENQNKQFLVYLFGKYRNLERCTRVLYAILRFIDKLFKRSGINRYINMNPMLARSLSSTGGMYLSFKISQLTSDYIPLNIYENSEDKRCFIIEKEHFEICFLAIMREAVIMTEMSLILSLYPDQIQTMVKEYEILVIFIDTLGFLKVYNIMDNKKQTLTLQNILSNQSYHRYLLPKGILPFDLSFKYIDYVHRTELCLGPFLLAQHINKQYFVLSINKVCQHVVYNCFYVSETGK